MEKKKKESLVIEVRVERSSRSFSISTPPVAPMKSSFAPQPGMWYRPHCSDPGTCQDLGQDQGSITGIEAGDSRVVSFTCISGHKGSNDIMTDVVNCNYNNNNNTNLSKLGYDSCQKHNKQQVQSPDLSFSGAAWSSKGHIFENSQKHLRHERCIRKSNDTACSAILSCLPDTDDIKDRGNLTSHSQMPEKCLGYSAFGCGDLGTGVTPRRPRKLPSAGFVNSSLGFKDAFSLEISPAVDQNGVKHESSETIINNSKRYVTSSGVGAPSVCGKSGSAMSLALLPFSTDQGAMSSKLGSSPGSWGDNDGEDFNNVTAVDRLGMPVMVTGNCGSHMVPHGGRSGGKCLNASPEPTLSKEVSSYGHGSCARGSDAALLSSSNYKHSKYTSSCSSSTTTNCGDCRGVYVETLNTTHNSRSLQNGSAETLNTTYNNSRALQDGSAETLNTTYNNSRSLQDGSAETLNTTYDNSRALQDGSTEALNTTYNNSRALQDRKIETFNTTYNNSRSLQDDSAETLNTTYNNNRALRDSNIGTHNAKCITSSCDIKGEDAGTLNSETVTKLIPTSITFPLGTEDCKSLSLSDDHRSFSQPASPLPMTPSSVKSEPSLSTSSSSPSLISLSNEPSSPAESSVVACKWHGCSCELDSSDLLEHIRKHAELQVERKTYACFWTECKVFNKPSWSCSWLERHIISHSGHRPFKCILDNCGQRFHSQVALEKHVNGHFAATSPDGARSSNRPRDDFTHRMLQKRRRQVKRRFVQTVKRNDIFDEQTMSVIKQELHSLMDNTKLDLVSFALHITFHGLVIGRRLTKSGSSQSLVEFRPYDVLDSKWMPEDQTQKLTEVVTPFLTVPPDSMMNLHTSFYRHHRFRKHRRK